MSIIFGIFDKRGQGFDKHWLYTMETVLEHGSPDRKGIWYNEKAGLGNLLIFNTPESLTEMLPLHDPLSNLSLCSDARLDNRENLITRIGISTNEFQILPDSEILFRAYQKWGADCAQHLRGDFSFAVYDGNEHQLFLARDQMGIKTLYYYEHPDFFIFSTELRGILALPFFKKELNMEWFLDFLINNSRNDFDAFYKGIYALPPGNCLIVTSGKTTLKKYWELKVPAKLKFKDNREYIEKYKELFDKSVINRVRSAFPVGSELSGGLDSSSIAAIAQKHLKSNTDQLHVFARVLPEQFIPELDDSGKDESKEISLVCDFCDIRQLHNITLEDQKISENIHRIIEVVKSPYQSNYATYNLNVIDQAASYGVHTILSGHGGDQMLTNPAHFVYRNYLKSHRYWSLFSDIRAKDTIHELGFIKAFKYMIQLRSEGNNSPKKRNEIKKLYKFGIDQGLINKYDLEGRYLEQRHKAVLLPECENDLIRKITHPHMRDRIEITGIMAGYQKIEFRYPFFDIDLIEYYLSVPEDIKRKFRIGRYIHRMAMQDELPPPIQWRKDKDGTINPGLSRLFANDAEKIRNDMSFLLNIDPDEASGIFESGTIKKLIADTDANLFIYKSLVNKYYQIVDFKKYIF